MKIKLTKIKLTLRKAARKLTAKQKKTALIVGLSMALPALLGVFYLLYALLVPLPISEPRALIVEPGSSLSAIAHDLQRQGQLRHIHMLLLYARLRQIADDIHAGEYQLRPGISALGLLRALVRGRVIQYSLTLVEGWTFREIMQAVRQQPNIRQTLPSVEPKAVMSALGKPNHFAEGGFYPDTYHYPKGITDVEFLSRAHERLRTILQEEWEGRAVGLPYASPEEALIMASIVEKETAVAAERSAIAGVFVRRLQKGMRLQTDPTVIYALGIGFDGNLRRRDLNFDSPYNTYRYAGLPPTPIAAAGREAIHAALHPRPGETLYFVSRGDGSHQFSATLEEHNAAVKKYQIRRR